MGGSRRWGWTSLWKHVIKMKKIVLAFILLFFSCSSSADTVFNDLKDKKTSYLDFVLLKIENKLVQRHSLLRAQLVPLRVQFQNIGSQVDFLQKDNKIVISIIGIMDKKRYSSKKYVPKITDCNILRNVLVYGKQGYNLIFKKRNSYLTDTVMEEIFTSRFLNNLSLSKEEKIFILTNTSANVKISDPVRGNDISCSGNIARELN